MIVQSLTWTRLQDLELPRVLEIPGPKILERKPLKEQAVFVSDASYNDIRPKRQAFAHRSHKQSRSKTWFHLWQCLNRALTIGRSGCNGMDVVSSIAEVELLDPRSSGQLGLVDLRYIL